MERFDSILIFGGTGFIGTHLTQHFIREKLASRITLVDLNPPRQEPYTSLLQDSLASGLVQFVRWDVRQPIPDNLLDAPPQVIFNLAAVHREPGHQPHEYFETNLLGAENVCAYAAAVQCQQIVFTSSIATYGPCDEERTEQSLPVPDSPYGSSKLVAEKIHLAWQRENPQRTLLLVRPGVIFGSGEGGNVTRLVQSVIRGYFVFIGNQATRKAGGYVKELCWVMLFGLQQASHASNKALLLNFSMDKAPTLQQYIDVTRRCIARKTTPPSVPRGLVLAASQVIDVVARLFNIKQPINPVRVRKLYRSTDVQPAGLRILGYQWKYDLDSAFDDWKRESPDDFRSLK